MNNGMIIIPIFLCINVGQGRGKVAGIDSDGLTGRERSPRVGRAHGIRRTGGDGPRSPPNASRRILYGPERVFFSGFFQCSDPTLKKLPVPLVLKTMG